MDQCVGVCGGGSDAAAWVQAIFSIVAIVVAAWFPYWMANRERARRVTGMMNLVGSLSDRAELACNAIADSLNSVAYLHEHKAGDVAEFLTAIDAIPLDNLPDPKLTLVMVGLRERLRELQALRDRALRLCEHNYPITKQEAEKAIEIRDAIEAHYGTTVEIDRAHTPLTRKQRRAMRAAGVTPGAKLPDAPA